MSKPRTNRAAELLTDSVAELLNSDVYQNALRFRQSFHSYSFRNTWLIMVQCPQASLVSGYRKWQSLGRQVQKGEKSIAILAPMVGKRKKEDSEESVCYGFRSVNVFDVSQTEGDDLPTVPSPQPLTGDSEAIQAATAGLIDFANKNGMSVSFETLDGPNGSYTPATKKITVNDQLAPAQALKTLIHEIAHGLFEHGPANQYHLAELEAESTAFLVCDSLGLDSSQYSFAYLAGWSKNPTEILGAAERACKVAEKILEAVTFCELAAGQLQSTAAA